MTGSTHRLLLFLAGAYLGLILVWTSKGQNAANFSWTEGINRLANSSFIMTRRSADGSCDVFNFQTNGGTLGQASLKDGMNRFAVAQISTNNLGNAYVTPFSGEVWVAKNSIVVIEPKGTNIYIVTSTNMGRDGWILAGTNKIAFPPADVQRYFKGIADLQIRLTNQLIFPPSP